MIYRFKIATLVWITNSEFVKVCYYVFVECWVGFSSV